MFGMFSSVKLAFIKAILRDCFIVKGSRCINEYITQLKYSTFAAVRSQLGIYDAVLFPFATAKRSEFALICVDF